MKKLTALILALALIVCACFSIASCGSGDIKVNPDKEEYVIGICQLAVHESLDKATQGFMDALEQELTAKGRMVKFDLQNAAGETNTCTTIMNTFVANDVDLIMANATAALQAAYNATATIPVLGTSVTDYGVALEIENFDGVVGNNVSGTSDAVSFDAQAQMMIDSLGLKAGDAIGVVYCSAEPNSLYQYEAVKAYFESQGITSVTAYTFTDSNDLASVVTGAASNCKAIYIPSDNTAAANDEAIDNICRPAKVPVFTSYASSICYGTMAIDYYELGVETGKMAAKVLLGEEDITKMPVKTVTAIKKYNEDVCAELGISTDTE